MSNSSNALEKAKRRGTESENDETSSSLASSVCSDEPQQEDACWADDVSAPTQITPKPDVKTQTPQRDPNFNPIKEFFDNKKKLQDLQREPSFTPRGGNFWGHDDRGVTSDSPLQSGRGRGGKLRKRGGGDENGLSNGGGRGKGNSPSSFQKGGGWDVPSTNENDSKWSHDKFGNEVISVESNSKKNQDSKNNQRKKTLNDFHNAKTNTFEAETVPTKSFKVKDFSVTITKKSSYQNLDQQQPPTSDLKTLSNKIEKLSLNKTEGVLSQNQHTVPEFHSKSASQQPNNNNLSTSSLHPNEKIQKVEDDDHQKRSSSRNSDNSEQPVLQQTTSQSSNASKNSNYSVNSGRGGRGRGSGGQGRGRGRGGYLNGKGDTNEQNNGSYNFHGGDYPVPPSFQQVMTSTGQVVLVTENGMIVPPDQNYPNYMYQYPQYYPGMNHGQYPGYPQQAGAFYYPPPQQFAGYGYYNPNYPVIPNSGVPHGDGEVKQPSAAVKLNSVRKEIVIKNPDNLEQVVVNKKKEEVSA